MNGIVVNGSLNRRSSPDAGSTILGQYHDGEYIEVYVHNADWYRTVFTYNGVSTVGYVNSDYVIIPDDTVIIRKNDVNVRNGMGTNAAYLYTVDSGATALVTAIGNPVGSTYGWIEGNYGNGVGWVRGDMFKKDTSTSGSTSDDYTIPAIVDTEKHGTGGTLNLRDTAGGTTIVTIPDGATIYVKSMSGTWLAAKYGNYVGYVKAEFVVGTDAYIGDDSSGNTSNNTLQKGDSGTNVTTLQNRLTALLYYCGTPDGQFGQQTYLAVKFFQERNGLSVDGVVGPNTWNVLNSSSAIKGVDSRILSWQGTQQPVVFYQDRNFWASYPYDANNTSATETIGASACGPTSMAMVVSTLLKKAVIPPILSDWAINNGYRDHNGENGTNFNFFRACANHFGLTYGGTLSEPSTATFNTIKNWCANGGLAIINAYSASPYTSSGHYVVCYKVDNNIVYIQESNAGHGTITHRTVSDWINGADWFGNIALIK